MPDLHPPHAPVRRAGPVYRAAASAFVLGALAAQLLAQTLDTDAQLWPFAPYGMYSLAHEAGASFTVEELHLLRSGEPGASREIGHADLSLMKFVYMRLVSDAAGSESPEQQEAFSKLDRLVRGRFGSGFDRAEIRRRRYTIGEGGLVSRDPPQLTVLEWSWPRGGRAGGASPGAGAESP